MIKKLTTCFLCTVLSLTISTACGGVPEQPQQPLTAAELIDLGEKYLLELNYEQALVQFLAVIEIEPMNPRGYTGAAEAYLGLGQSDNAVMVLRDGTMILPNNAEIEAMLDVLTQTETDIMPDSEIGNAQLDAAIAGESLTDMQRFLRDLLADYEEGGTDRIYSAIKTDRYQTLTEQASDYPVIYIDGTHGYGAGLYFVDYGRAVYIGDYDDSVRSGYGIWILVDSHINYGGIYIFEGEWANDFPNGQGTITSTFISWDSIVGTQSFSGFLVDGSWDGRVLWRDFYDEDWYVYFSNGREIQFYAEDVFGREESYFAHAVNDESRQITGGGLRGGILGFGRF